MYFNVEVNKWYGLPCGILARSNNKRGRGLYMLTWRKLFSELAYDEQMHPRAGKQVGNHQTSLAKVYLQNECAKAPYAISIQYKFTQFSLLLSEETNLGLC